MQSPLLEIEEIVINRRRRKCSGACISETIFMSVIGLIVIFSVVSWVKHLLSDSFLPCKPDTTSVV